MMAASDRTAVVIGGGMSGLACAALLARDGYHVTLLEKSAELGGRAGSWQRDGFRFDIGSSWYLMPEAFDHFFRLLGTTAAEQLDLVQLDPAFRVFGADDEAPLDVAADAQGNIDLFESVERGSGARLTGYLESGAEARRAGDAALFYSTLWSGERLSSNIAREALGSARRLGWMVMTPLSRLIRRTVKDRRLRGILGWPSMLLGSSPDRVPALYSMLSQLVLADGVLYPIGGLARVVAAVQSLAVAEGAQLRTELTVRRILVEKGAATGVEVADSHGAISFVDADLIVSTVDLHHSETVLLTDEATRTYPRRYWDALTPGSRVVLLLLGVSGELPELEHHSLFFGTSGTGSPEVPLYVGKPSGVDPQLAPEEAETLFVSIPVAADSPLWHGGVDRGGDAELEDLADAAVARISQAAGIPDLADRVLLRRTVGPADLVEQFNTWQGGAALGLRQSAFFRQGSESAKVRGLYLAGTSAVPGFGLASCLITAELVLKRVRADSSAGPLAEPLQPTHPR